MTDIERTMREEKWMLTNELFLPDRPEPPEVVAFRMLQEADWIYFLDDVYDNPGMKFFNPETRGFSHADSWEELGALYGVEPFRSELAIPDGIPENVKDFCRELRNSMRVRGEEGCGGCKAFYAPGEWVDPVDEHVLLVVCHDGGAMASWFNLNYDQIKLYDSVDLMLRSRGLWREHEDAAVSHIYKA
jgi:hypothetical protein